MGKITRQAKTCCDLWLCWSTKNFFFLYNPTYIQSFNLVPLTYNTSQINLNTRICSLNFFIYTKQICLKNQPKKLIYNFKVTPSFMSIRLFQLSMHTWKSNKSQITCIRELKPQWIISFTKLYEQLKLKSYMRKK